MKIIIHPAALWTYLSERERSTLKALVVAHLIHGDGTATHLCGGARGQHLERSLVEKGLIERFYGYGGWSRLRPTAHGYRTIPKDQIPSDLLERRSY